MRKIILLIVFLLLSCLILESIVIKDLGKPYGLYVNKNNVYIYDGSIFSYKIYSLTSFKKIGEFGKKGEGPGEFKGTHEVSFYNNEIVLGGSFSLFRFSNEGIFINQSKAIPYVYLKPVGENFVGVKRDYNKKELKSYNIVRLYNKQLSTVKPIYKQYNRKMLSENQSTKQNVKMVHPFFKVQTLNDKIFIADCRKGFYIKVFNSLGVQLYEILKKLPKVEIDQEFKDKIMQKYKTSKYWIENKRNFNYIFPKYFSSIKNFKVADNKIYVITNFKKNGHNQLIIMDLSGNIQKKTFIPYNNQLFDIKNEKYYYIEDIDEEWVLSIIKL